MNISDLVPWSDRRSVRQGNGGDAMNPMRREMDRLFEEFFRGWEPDRFRGAERSAFNPALNLAETGDTIEATMELPGLSEDDIEITLAREGLTITGEKKREEEEHDKNYFRRERSYGYFRRTIPLPADVVDADKAQAEFDRGVLRITMPKREMADKQARRISVKSG